LPLIFPRMYLCAFRLILTTVMKGNQSTNFGHSIFTERIVCFSE
jgi:hypothetical protein